MDFPWSHRLLPKFIKDFAHIAKPLMTLTQHDTKFTWILTYQTVFVTLKEALIQALMLHYPDSSNCYIVYVDVSDDASDLMKSSSTWMNASLQQQQVFCLENISTTIGQQSYN